VRNLVIHKVPPNYLNLKLSLQNTFRVKNPNHSSGKEDNVLVILLSKYLDFFKALQVIFLNPLEHIFLCP